VAVQAPEGNRQHLPGLIPVAAHGQVAAVVATGRVEAVAATSPVVAEVLEEEEAATPGKFFF